MKKRTCVVLVQHRIASEYNDFIGKFYHFPLKYLKLLQKDNIEFIYFEPTTKKGANSYFGYGKLGKIFADKRVKDHYFVEIFDYKPLSNDVPFYTPEGELRETGPSYNPQNSARKISSETLDGICLDGGIILNFKADAHLVRVLGEELIATEVVGILELIKNAYDANASECLVRIEKIPDLQPCDESEYLFNEYEGPVIVIEDDGIGMDRDAIENGWMRPASTLKTSVKDRLKKEKKEALKSNKLGAFKSLVKELKKHYKGRLPLGEKGVGRFATHRLGRKVLITTKTEDIDFEYVLEIDWDKFDSNNEAKHVDLDEIGVTLTRQSPSRDYGPTACGTRLIVYGGREGYKFTESVIKKINKSIQSLSSPRMSSENFSANFECPQVADLEAKPLIEEYLPAFSLDALVDEKGVADFELKFTPPSSVPLPSEEIHKKDIDLRKTDVKEPLYWIIDESGRKREPQCGFFFLHVDFYYRSKPWVNGPNVKDLSDYLDNYGGISIYRDGLNIFPAEWGAEVDWLELSKRHIKKVVSISYYNFIGNLELEQTKNLNLVDKTDRQGLLDNLAFNDLRRLVRNLLFEVEIHYKGKRQKRDELTKGYIREPKELAELSRQGAMFINRFSNRYDTVQDSLDVLSGFGPPESRKDRLLNVSESLKTMGKSLKIMQEVQDLLSEQAGFGLAIGVAVHEVSKITANFYTGIVKMLKKGPDRKTLENLKASSSSLKTELKRFGSMRAIRNESPTEFNVKDSIRFCQSIYKRKFDKIGIDFKIDGDKGFLLYTRYGAVNQIISNLIDNSCYWLSDPGIQEKRIVIEIDIDKRRLIIADNGPDIDDSIRPHLFEPGYSLKIPPSGLGLYICKYYLRSMKGDIHELSAKERISGMKGAHFVLDFSRVPDKKEE